MQNKYNEKTLWSQLQRSVIEKKTKKKKQREAIYLGKFLF